jgi:hypothetical protein
MGSLVAHGSTQQTVSTEQSAAQKSADTRAASSEVNVREHGKETQINEDYFFLELYSVHAVDGLWLDVVVQGACMNATIHLF